MNFTMGLSHLSVMQSMAQPINVKLIQCFDFQVVEMLKYLNNNKEYQCHDVTVSIGDGHVYSQTGQLTFRVWTNKQENLRRHAYTTVVLTPSYRVTEQETVKGVATAAVKDLARLTDLGVCHAGEILVLNADGTHKNKSASSTTGPWFLDAQMDPEIVHLVKKYKIDFATMVTEDSDIFSSIPGKTDVRGKGSQFEASFNFIHHFALSKDNEDCGFVMCIDADLKGTDGFVFRMCLGLHEGFSYLVPLYWRYKYEGRATNHLMFPLYAAITRNVVRQPIGGEFAFDAKMLARFTEVDRWSKGWRDFGIDMGMTITAGTSGHAIGQVVLPRKINYVGQDARIQIGDIFVQEGRSLFNGLLDFIESHSNNMELNKVTPVPTVETEAVQSNTNVRVELSDSTEILGALSKFLILYTSPAFQNDKNLLGSFSDCIENAYNQFKEHDLFKILKLGNLKAIDEDQKSEFLHKIQCLDNSMILHANEWAEIVFKCFKEFQIRRKRNEEKATTAVIRNVLLCAFYLRVFSFNFQTYNLPSYPDAEDLLTQQMYEFSKIATTILF